MLTKDVVSFEQPDPDLSIWYHNYYSKYGTKISEQAVLAKY